MINKKIIALSIAMLMVLGIVNFPIAKAQDEIVNVDCGTRDIDGDRDNHDIYFYAHIEGNGAQNIHISVYNQFNIRVRDGYTDENGELSLYDFTNGDYTWIAKDSNGETIDNGAVNINSNINSGNALTDMDGDYEYDDFYVFVYDNNYNAIRFHYTITNDSGTFAEGDANGFYWINNLPIGYYNFTAENSSTSVVYHSGMFYSYGTTPVTGIINVENGVIDNDGNGQVNDIGFYAHIENKGIQNIHITIYDKDGNYVNDGYTDSSGLLFIYNLNNGNYTWSAENETEIIEYGAFNVDNIQQHLDWLSDMDGDSEYDDFWFGVRDVNNNGISGIHVVITNDTGIYSEGYTDSDGNFYEYNLPKGYYNYTAQNESLGVYLQNGTFYSYGISPTATVEIYVYNNANNTQDVYIEVRNETDIVYSTTISAGPGYNYVDRIELNKGNYTFNASAEDGTNDMQIINIQSNTFVYLNVGPAKVDIYVLNNANYGQDVYIEVRNETDIVYSTTISAGPGNNYVDTIELNKGNYTFNASAEDGTNDMQIMFIENGINYLVELIVGEGIKNGNIEGVVRGYNSALLSGVVITVIGTTLSATTDSNGYYKITNVPEGTYSIKAEHPDYNSQTKTNINIPGEKTVIANFNLQIKTGTLIGTVKDKIGNPIEGVNITVDETSLSASTDSEGKYTIPNVPIKQRTIRAEKTNYREVVQIINIAVGTNTLDFKMEYLLPKLSAVEIYFQNNPYENSNVEITIKVRNDGGGNAEDVSVKLKIDGNEIEQKIVNVQNYSSQDVIFTWNAVKGVHEISVEINSILQTKMENITVQELPKGTLKGVVKDKNQVPINNTLVEVIGTGLSAYTDSNGSYIITNITIGQKIIKVSKPNYSTIEKNYTISTGDNILDFEIEYLLPQIIIKDIKVIPELPKEGESAKIKITIENIGGAIGTIIIKVKINDVEVDSKNIQIGKGEESTVEFDWIPSSSGTIEITIEAVGHEIEKKITRVSAKEQVKPWFIPGFEIWLLGIAILVAVITKRKKYISKN